MGAFMKLTDGIGYMGYSRYYFTTMFSLSLVRLIEIMTYISHITRKVIYDKHPLYFFKLSLGGGNLVGELGPRWQSSFPNLSSSLINYPIFGL